MKVKKHLKRGGKILEKVKNERKFANLEKKELIKKIFWEKRKVNTHG